MACMGQRPAKGKESSFPWQHIHILYIYIFIYMLYVYRIQSDVGLQPVLQLCLKCKYQGISPFAHMRQDASSRKSRDGQLDWFGFINSNVVLLSALCPHPHHGMQMWRATPKDGTAWIPNSLSKVDWCQIYVKLHVDNDCMVNIEFRERLMELLWEWASKPTTRPSTTNLNCSRALPLLSRVKS